MSKSSKRIEIESWTDILGQEIRVGDTVGYASINGRSPQLVIAVVKHIYSTDSTGTPLVSWRYDYVNRQRVMEPSCSYAVAPIIDARDFYRSTNTRLVTLKFPNNVIKVDPSYLEAQRESQAQDLLRVAQELES